MQEVRHSITVVGAGVVGIACAVHLLRDGHRVTIVDRSAPGEACSFGNAGVLASYGCLPVSHPGLVWSVPGMLLRPTGALSIRWRYWLTLFPWLVKFLRAGRMHRMQSSARALSFLVAGSLEQHRDLARGTGVETLLRPAPLVYAYADERKLAEGLMSWEWRRPYGVDPRVVRGEALRELEPALSPHLPCAVVIDDCGHTTDPARLVKGLASYAQRNGATLLERDVLDIRPRESGGVLVTTDAGDMLSEKVVIAAGAWSGKLAARCGEPVPLEAERGYHVVLRNPGVAPRSIVGSASGKFLATPMDDGLRLAGTSEFAGLDAAPDYRRAEVLRRQARDLFPDANIDDYSQWMGPRPSLPDSLPVIGASRRHAGVYYAFGHQHVGLTCAPRTGRLIADLIAGRVPNIDLDAYRIDRFGA
jgi:D-amino-acid dehydrogenase